MRYNVGDILREKNGNWLANLIALKFGDTFLGAEVPIDEQEMHELCSLFQKFFPME